MNEDAIAAAINAQTSALLGQLEAINETLEQILEAMFERSDYPPFSDEEVN